MTYILQTERLFLREIQLIDVDDLFEMDSDPEVHQYIDKKPVQSKEEVIETIHFIRKQYQENGIGRWAVIDQSSGECVGWCGLKFFRERLNKQANIYELGYRFKRKHWGKGYASESAKAVVNYGFEVLDLEKIYAITDPENSGSRHVLEKLGFQFVELFKDGDDLLTWYSLAK
ncbi:GNAT family N-acetyltransferase [Sphingobacterium hungaricum]|uniref:GNAT family N-acetyltransferase n=1 Tax=Sphingobacterium hungaricum TaxID=2082723 RepID=A0A928UXQ2_9SPHI|nr:GNAT family N-acetyltransferase [Sphingobacterium hungaricum]MBE8713034.1 GNAT family N-acetyltransferase [Sphingobacterium hungaricum]